MRPPPLHPLLGAAALALLAGPGAGTAQGTAGLRPGDLYRVLEIRDPAVAPGGEMVAFTVLRPVRGEARLHREIWVQPLDGVEPDGDPVRFSDPSEESHSPRWSPDGALLSFVSRRRGDPNPVWFLRTSGPGGEAFHIPGVSGVPTWSPDGDRIAFLAEGPSGRLQLHVVARAGGEPRRLTDGELAVSEPVWGRDGDRLYFIGEEPRGSPGSVASRRDLWTVPVEDGDVLRVTDGSVDVSAPAVSPDGDRIAFLRRTDPGGQSEIAVARLGLQGAFREDPLVLTGGHDRSAGAPVWSPDGASLYFPARDGGRRHVFRVGREGGSLTRVTTGDRRVGDFALSRDGSILAFAASDATRPMELFVSRGDGASEDRATGFHDALVEDRELVGPTRLTWSAEEGAAVEGWIVEPVGFRPGQSYGLVLLVHDGPHDAHGHGFEPRLHALSGAGFFVLHANPRGSSGYGEEFRLASRGEWGIVDKEDLLAGVDAALSRFPEIDPERLAVMGEGYGGFMANWLSATSDRFRAAVSIRGVASWESWYGTSEARALAETGLGGPPWERRSLYRRLSPLSYVENVNAATLLFHDEDNPRMPLGESEQWHTALRRRGVEVDFVRYPASARLDDGRLGTRARVDLLDRCSGWLRRWIGPDASPGRVSEGPPTR